MQGKYSGSKKNLGSSIESIENHCDRWYAILWINISLPNILVEIPNTSCQTIRSLF